MNVVRRMVHVLVIVLTLVVGATAAAVIVTQTAWFKNWLRGYVIQESYQYLNGQLSIERLGGNLFFGIEMENVGLSMDGTEVVTVEDLGLDYNVFALISSGMSIDDLRLNRPTLYLRRDGDAWSITRLIKKQEQEADREGPASPIAIDNIVVTDASIVIDAPVGTSGVDLPDRFDELDMELSFQYEPVHYSVDITRVTFRGSEPAIGLNELSGHVSVRNDTVSLESVAVKTEESSLAIDGSIAQYLTKPVFQLQVSSDKLSIPEISRVVPALAGIRLQPAFEFKANGPMDRLGIDMNVRSSAGQITGQLTADMLMPGQSVSGEVTVRNLDLGPIVRNPARKTDLTGSASIDLTAEEFAKVDSIRGSVTVDAPRIVASGYTAEHVTGSAQIADGRAAIDAKASAYGAAATTRGRVTLPSDTRPLAYDLRGTARHVDLRRLPRTLNVPRAATNVNAAYHVVGTEPGQQRNSRRVRADVTFADSTVAGAAIERGSTVAVVMNGRQLAYEADLAARGVDPQRSEFNVPALAADRYQSTINARVTARGQGTDPKAIALTANGTVTDSTLVGGRIPQLTFDATIADDTAHVTAAGSFANFDPSVARGPTPAPDAFATSSNARGAPPPLASLAPTRSLEPQAPPSSAAPRRIARRHASISPSTAARSISA